MVSMVVKATFIDSYMLVKTMVSYMEVAPQSEITYDLYDKKKSYNYSLYENRFHALQVGRIFSCAALQYRKRFLPVLCRKRNAVLPSGTSGKEGEKMGCKRKSKKNEKKC
ncbi:MAG: hypothetical protein HDR24_12300 [Lachnospiraceae bacterium]|nr:hypothetical protein [Lachnospiraceae bacterium]